MNSQTYRQTVSRIVRNTMRKQFPTLNKNVLKEASAEIAKAVHARFYGTAVDDVASPIWRDDPRYAAEFSDAQATKTAEELLNSGD